MAGSLQDWCRATIIGRRTFGKGLVQDQYSLSDGAAIRLTIARYYTPLGRSIQRSYEKGKKIYLDEMWDRFNSGEMFSQDSVRNNNTGQRFYSMCNDTLYDGGGITPDIFVPADSILYKNKLGRWLSGNRLSNYVYNYYLQHTTELSKYRSSADYNANFPLNKLWDGFAQKSAGDSLDVNILNSREKLLLQLRLKGMLARYRWRNSGFFEVINADDVVIRKALETITK